MPMDEASAREIADHWSYPPPYDFYDATADPDDHREFVTPAAWPSRFYRVEVDGRLAGFCSLDIATDHAELALGLHPDLTGRGLGVSFLRECLTVARRDLDEGLELRLSVAEFNVRAIRVYQQVGFVETRHYVQETNGGRYDFVEMTLVG